MSRALSPHPVTGQDGRVILRALIALVLAGAPTTQDPGAPADAPPATARFQSRSLTWAMELPADWRQVSPDESRSLRNLLPGDVSRTNPLSFYCVGPVERWKAGDYDGVHLWVVEQDGEWILKGMDVAAELRAKWASAGPPLQMAYTVAEVRQVELGQGSLPAVASIRLAEPADGSRPVRSLDLHVPTGGRTVSFSFRCWADEFDHRVASFRSMAETLTVARKPRGEVTLSDRLWTPLITGGIVGAILLVLYRRMRRHV